MEVKSIEFDQLQEICRHCSKCGNHCSDDDNFTGECTDSECPIWSELGVWNSEEDGDA